MTAEKIPLREKPKYPFAVFFIIGNEFCERFSFYGMKAVLTLYFVTILGWTDNTATVTYHAFVMLCYFTPIIGAFISDSFLGKFRTIFYISIIYAAGSIILSVSAVGPLNLPHVELSLLGLVLIGLGTGGIKPCVAAFGGDQFAASQEKERQRFFSIFYFAINTGSLLSIFVTPVLREDVPCFGSRYCFPLAFGVPAILMIVSLVLFLLGKPLYKIVPPGGTILVDVAKCIGLGIRGKLSSRPKRDHWLDYADEKFETKFIEDVKAVTRVLFLYIPLPIFWALFDQQGSRWTLQATRMDGKVVESWILKPDQIQVINPLFILAMIPVFDMLVYPLFAKCNLLVKPLHRIVVGGFLAAAAFVIAGFVQIALENSFPVPPAEGISQFNIINLSPCHLTGHLNGTNIEFSIASLKNQTLLDLKADVNHTSLLTFNCSSNGEFTTIENKIIDFYPESGKSVMILISQTNGKIETLTANEKQMKAEKGNSDLMLMHYLPGFIPDNATVKIRGRKEGKSYEFQVNNKSAVGLTEYQLIEPDTYDIYLPDLDNPGMHVEKSNLSEIVTRQGAVYSLIVFDDNGSVQIELLESIAPNSLKMLWQVPQYFVITLGEIMFSITGLEFSYSQAPPTMKAVLQAAWLLTVAVGNAVVIIIAEAQIFEKQSYEFFLFSCLMGLDMILFMLMARSYVYVQQPTLDSIDEKPIPENSSSPNKNGVNNQAFENEEDTKM